MFSKKKLSTSDAFTNLIASGTKLSGTVRFMGTIKIEGDVTGDVLSSVDMENASTENKLIVAKGGIVSSQKISAAAIVIDGAVTSESIWAESELRILRGAIIKDATIYYRNLEIEPGALLSNCVLKHLDHTSEGEQT